MKIVFIVDDDAAHLRVCERVLKRAGYGVVTASTGAEALRILAQTSVDVILCDVVMPDKDGLEVLMQLRGKRSVAPIVSMSGSGGPEMNATLLSQCRLLGASIVLSKPFSAEQLLAAIANALAGKKSPVFFRSSAAAAPAAPHPPAA